MSEARTVDNTGKVEKTGLEAMGIYTGTVSQAGALSNGPAGWSVSGPTSSVFTVTHNLGLTANSYHVFIQIDGTASGYGIIETRGANSFTVETTDLATPTVGDRAFTFLLIKGDGE